MRPILLLTLITLLCASCAARTAPEPTSTPLPTATFTLEPTVIPTDAPTATRAASPTPRPTQTTLPATATPEGPALPPPVDKPLREWQGFPVMPQAIAASGDQGSYYYSVEAFPADIEAYYQSEMAKRGWDLFASGEGETGTMMLIFMKDTDTVTVSILVNPDESIYVLLVK